MDAFVIAGAVSTALFAVANLPMIVKAVRTGDLASYSLANLLLVNAANVVHSAYVFSLPAGPIWALHGFYLVSMALMLLLYARFVRRARVVRQYPEACSTEQVSSMPGATHTPHQTGRLRSRV